MNWHFLQPIREGTNNSVCVSFAVRGVSVLPIIVTSCIVLASLQQTSRLTRREQCYIFFVEYPNITNLHQQLSYGGNIKWRPYAIPFQILRSFLIFKSSFINYLWCLCCFISSWQMSHLPTSMAQESTVLIICARWWYKIKAWLATLLWCHSLKRVILFTTHSG